MDTSTGAGVVVDAGSGTWLGRPAAVDIGKIGFFYYVIPTSPTNPDTCWLTVLIVGVLTWKQIGGTGAAGAMKYFVNNSPTAAPQPLCLYSTVAAAQTAALADGHDTNNPAALWLLPTATPFTENVTMSPGISMQGMVSASQGGAMPQITGIVDTTDGGSFVISDLAINGQLICTGNKPTNLQIDNVNVNQTGANSPVSLTNSNLVMSTNRFFVVCQSASAFAAVDITGTVTWTAVEGQIITDSDRVAISAVNAAGALIINMMEVRIQGTIAMTDKVTITMRQGRIVTTSTMCTFTTAGTLVMYQCEVDIGDGTLIATGPGVVRDVDCFFPSGATGVGITVTTTSVRYTTRLRTEILFEGAGPYTITTLADLYLIDVASGGAGNKVVNLPLLTAVPRGFRFRIQKINSLAANTVTITRNGGETINGLAANIVLAASVLTGAELQAGSATLTDWRAWGSTAAV